MQQGFNPRKKPRDDYRNEQKTTEVGNCRMGSWNIDWYWQHTERVSFQPQQQYWGSDWNYVDCRMDNLDDTGVASGNC